LVEAADEPRVSDPQDDLPKMITVARGDDDLPMAGEQVMVVGQRHGLPIACRECGRPTA